MTETRQISVSEPMKRLRLGWKIENLELRNGIWERFIPDRKKYF